MDKERTHPLFRRIDVSILSNVNSIEALPWDKRESRQVKGEGRNERKGKSSWTLTRLLLVSIAPSTCVTVNKGASELLGELDGPVGTSKMANYFKSCALRDRAKRYRDDS